MLSCDITDGPEVYKSVLNAAELWDLQVKEIRKDIEIAGSPERCELRFVVQDSDDRLFVMESIFDEDIDHKLKIIFTLDFFSKQGLAGIQPYLRNVSNEYIVLCDERFWQVMPFVDGISLDRPGYVFDKWRGKVLAGFLIDMRARSENVPYFDISKTFSIKTYIYELADQIKEHELELSQRITPVIKFLEKNFMNVHDNLPAAFCHGDYHPLNIIWLSDTIKTVIDWEFLGYKPEAYDAANMVGCLGIEDPECLDEELVEDFLLKLKMSDYFSDLSFEYLFELVVAIRFAWLAEWLRLEDREMIGMETEYMCLLMDNALYFKKAWSVA